MKSNCFCHSGVPYQRCCRPYHTGKWAPTPIALMRSRYAAYALGKVGYLMRTQHPDGLADAVDTLAARKALQLFCQKSTFLGLAILNETTLSAIEATVTFQALLQQDGRDASFREKSLFRIKNGRWLYVAAV